MVSTVMIHNITWLGDLKFKAEWDGLEIHSHETEKQEDLEAPPPGVIFVASLGLCTASRIIGTCKKKGWKVEDLNIKLTPQVNRNEWRAESFLLEIELKADLSEKNNKTY